jgi:methionine-rich copper-binding protein CopC
MSPRIPAALAFTLAATSAFAHAQLDHASPPVGGTVSSPSELRLTFTEGLEPKFSGLTLSAAGGAAEPLGKIGVDPSDDKILVVKVGKTLPPGVYTVKWHAVSVDTHHTQGSFEFTVTP